MPGAEAPVSDGAEKLRRIAERAPEIRNDLLKLADDLARARGPTSCGAPEGTTHRQPSARAAVRRRLAILLPVLKFGRLHRFWGQ
jgi:hypothetical protein